MQPFGITERPFLLPTAAAAAFSSFRSSYGKVMLSEKEASWSGVGRSQSSGIGMNSASSSSCWTACPVKGNLHTFHVIQRKGVVFHHVTVNRPFSARGDRSCPQSGLRPTSSGSPRSTPPCCPPAFLQDPCLDTLSLRQVLCPFPQTTQKPPGPVLHTSAINNRTTGAFLRDTH